jgi:uncharacterized protein (DUF4415 family)
MANQQMKKAQSKKKSGSSPRARRLRAKDRNMKKASSRMVRGRILNRPDEEINTSDSPVVSLRGGTRGLFFRPSKEAISIRLDSDILEWLRDNEPSYQTRINEVLRDYVSVHKRKK